MNQTFSLLQVTKSIQRTLSDRYGSTFWVRAEMNKLNHYMHSGHCYPELVEKENGKVIAQMNGILWKTDFLNANRKFLSTLKEPLRDGIKILFLAKVTFDPAHGLALQILDIDPAYTMGDLEKEKQDTLEKLRAEGIYGKNKSLPFPLLPQRIAIISVETSKGYADFLSVIDDNQWHYKFFHYLFPSLLQGEKAVDGIIGQLARIRKVLRHFDVVAIIRGGGGDVGLSCYNNYRLAKEIAEFPLPVITGIGHATNETVAEMISHLNAITPTKLADYLLQRFHNFSVPVQKAQEIVVNQSRRLLADNKNGLRIEVKLFRSVTANALIHNKNAVRSLSTSVRQESGFHFKNERSKLLHQRDSIILKSANLTAILRQQVVRNAAMLWKDSLSIFAREKVKIENSEKNIANMSPENVLRRGYSITLLNGHAITDAESVKPGDTIKTVLYKGSISGIAQEINKTEKNG
jgi:exodeoxyribonuclease VII large subunit